MREQGFLAFPHLNYAYFIIEKHLEGEFFAMNILMQTIKYIASLSCLYFILLMISYSEYDRSNINVRLIGICAAVSAGSMLCLLPGILIIHFSNDRNYRGHSLVAALGVMVLIFGLASSWSVGMWGTKFFKTDTTYDP